MTASEPPQPSVSAPRAVITAIARRLKYSWQALMVGARDDEVGLSIPPLAFWPHYDSTLLTDSDGAPAPVAGYVFHTNYVASTGGRISFRICLRGLVATSGSIYVSINAVNHRGDALAPRTRRFSLARLARTGGELTVSTLGVFGNSYAVFGTLSDGITANAETIEIFVTGADSDGAHLARFEAAQRGFLADPGEGVLADVIVNRAPNLQTPISQMCTASQMAEPAYRKTCGWMGQAPTRHRKQWEFVYIVRALAYHGVLRKGARGVGFGVGVEPLASLFGALGCEIVATDLAAEDHRARVWTETEQLGSDLAQIYHPELCPKDVFLKRVSFRTADMNAIPADLTGFDFTWSSCAYEHLGSIEAGLAFFENSLRCLKPGGIAVHTTELNLSSNDRTLDHGTTVSFRRRDFVELARRLIARGHEVMPITFDSGDAELDRMIDLPPYSNDPHLKLALLRWVSTSFGMIVRKAA